MSALDQWKRGKAEAPKGCVVLVLDEDRYWTFGLDAAQCAADLGVKMERHDGMDAVWIPWFEVEQCLEVLIRAGKKVVLDDEFQAEPLGKGGRR